MLGILHWQRKDGNNDSHAFTDDTAEDVLINKGMGLINIMTGILTWAKYY